MLVNRIIKYLGIVSLTLSYLFLVLNYLKFGLDSKFSELFHTAWIFGIISVISNAVYVIRLNMHDDYLWWIGFVGLIWFVPFFIDFNTFYGIPSLLIYLILIIYIHRKGYLIEKTA